MKNKLFLLFLLGFAGIAFAQETQPDEETENLLRDKIAIGAFVGGTTGGSMTNDFYSTTTGADFTILKGLTKNLMVGGNVVGGIAHSKKEVNKDNLTYIWLGGSTRLYTDNNKFFIGVSAGYSMGQGDGGFYYQPKFGFDATDHFGFNVSYFEVDFDNSFSAASFGLEYSF